MEQEYLLVSTLIFPSRETLSQLSVRGEAEQSFRRMWLKPRSLTVIATTDMGVGALRHSLGVEPERNESEPPMTATKPKPRPNKSPVLLVTGGDTGIGLGIARKSLPRLAIAWRSADWPGAEGIGWVAALRSHGRRADPEQCRGNLKNKKKTRVDGRGEKSYAPTVHSVY